MFHDVSLVGTPLVSGRERRLALLVDAENVPRDSVGAIIDAVTRHGVVDIRRAYGDWAGGALKGWRDTLLDHAIRPVQQFGYTIGKNASDIALVIDAMELLHTLRPDGFCIVSSDADFTPLAMHLRANGLAVHGFGEAKTPRPFVTACTSFVDLAAMRAATRLAVATPVPTKAPTLQGSIRVAALVRAAVREAAGTDGWAALAAVGGLARRAGVDPKAYGCRTFTALFAALNLFEMRPLKAGHMAVRERRSDAIGAPTVAGPVATPVPPHPS